MPTAPKKRKHHLSASKDALLGEIRDLNFAVVGTRLSRLARRLEGDFGGAKNLKSVSQMKEFVGKIGGLQSEQQNLRLRKWTDTSTSFLSFHCASSMPSYDGYIPASSLPCIQT